MHAARLALRLAVCALLAFLCGCGRSDLNDFLITGSDGGDDSSPGDASFDGFPFDSTFDGPQSETSIPEGGVDASHCDSTSCPDGCCNANGVCEPGTSATLCGGGGEVCENCFALGYTSCDPAHQACERTVAGCSAANCKGCCAGDECFAGVDHGECGVGGAACVACQKGQSCAGGRCGTPTCDATNCNGCCLVNECLGGASNNACGNAGEQCQNCAGVGEVCEAVSGGGGACGGTAPCGPTNCKGCCQGNACLPGNTDSSCGVGGAACMQCSSTTMCGPNGQCGGMQACGPQSCPGCCFGSNFCVPGDNVNACGSHGAACENCGALNETCQNQSCENQGCNAQSCPTGCCAGNVCQAGTTNGDCGNGGAQCQSCSSNGETCASQMCVSTTCNAKTCPDGCCSSGVCVKGTSNSACGTGGASCDDCALTGETCQKQACVTTGCNASTCAGCCDATGACQPGFLGTACGGGGDKCQDCATLSPPQTCDDSESPPACTGSTQQCPAPYPGCPGSEMTPPLPQQVVCSTTELQNAAAACVAGANSTACENFFTEEAKQDPACASCLAPFDHDFTGGGDPEGVIECVAGDPQLTSTCNHEGACYSNCISVSCGECPDPTSEQQCRQSVNTGQCSSYAQPAVQCIAPIILNPMSPYAFCNPEGKSYGVWLQGVGTHYCDQ